MRGHVPALVILATGLLAWQLMHSVSGTSSISGPVETISRLAMLMSTERFWDDVAETGLAFLQALILSILIGGGAGVVLGLSRPTGEVIEPILVTFYSLPKVTLYPLVLLVFGLGMPAKIAFGVMHGFVPITLLTRNAILQIKPVYRKTAIILRLTPVQMITKLIVPAIIPELIVGIRIGFSLSLLGVLIGEMFASRRGLGFSAINAMNLGDISTILAIGLFLACFAAVINLSLLSIEKKVRHRTTR
ncbi:MAG: nitrate ABC transporter permease [Azospirillum brasilense]|nr:MAG: nitrate ABC transporter permease [Azospirillum brasilense]